MCGIVGYLGPKDPKKVIMQGLHNLEYRGYDSAGLVVLDSDGFKRIRAQGKLFNLEEKAKGFETHGHVGMGHTRWATHGVPSERNAHPHIVESISIVHNGIIENFLELKNSLLAKGVQFTSDTDSELIAHLLYKEIQNTSDLAAAVKRVIPLLKGAFSVLALWTDQPELIVAFKVGPPLVIGIGSGEMLVASDVQALLAYTKKVVYLDDSDIAVIGRENWSVFNSQKGATVTKKVEFIDWDAQQLEKKGYAHFMLKEIFEQPKAVASAIEPHIDLKNYSVHLQGLNDSALSEIDRISIVACGTSFYAGMLGKYLIEQFARIPVDIDVASEFRYRNPVLEKRQLVLVISQSGETADTLAALRLAKGLGVPTLSICNVRGSTIDRESLWRLYMNAGTEIGVASTKAFCSTLALFELLALYFAKAKGKLNREDEQQLIMALLSLPSLMEKVLAYNTFFTEAAHTLKSHKGFLYMGRGVSYPIAMEGALKLKELAYMHAEGYAAGEMKHGPLALIDEKMMTVMLVPSDSVYEKTVSNLQEVAARKGKIIAIGTGENPELQAMSQHYLSIPATHWAMSPLLTVIPLQLLAYHVSHAMGYDVDQPRNLAKSVTVE